MVNHTQDFVAVKKYEILQYSLIPIRYACAARMHVDVGVCMVQHVQHSVHSPGSKSQYLILLEAGEMVLVGGRKHLLNKYLHFKRCMTGL